MAPRGDSVNEEMRQRSRRRILRATITLVDQHGYARTTLSDIAEQAWPGGCCRTTSTANDS